MLSDTGNGTHLHISLWDGDRNLLAGGYGPAGMEPRAESFMAGILQELPALVAVTAPSCASYLRLQPQHWSGAMRCWGTENREAALRFIAGTTAANAGSANMEIKPVDGTANAYLALAAVLAAGIAGLEAGERLPPSTRRIPSCCRPRSRKRGGSGSSRPRFPRRRTARESSVLREAMGDFLFEVFLATRRGEAEQYEGFDDDRLIRALRWRY